MIDLQQRSYWRRVTSAWWPHRVLPWEEQDMLNGNVTRPMDQIIDRHGSPPEQASSPRSSVWHNVWQVLKTVQARLRFVVILALVGATIVYWDTLKTHYERWTRPILGAEAAVSADVEYWCPMHPTVVRDH